MTAHPAKPATCRKGFTVAELLVAMTVSSIVLAAVGALSFAVGSASRSTQHMNEAQIRLRGAMLHIHETIRNARIAWAVPTGVAVWKADDNADNCINGQELAYIEPVSVGGGLEQLQIVEFPGQTLTASIADITDGAARTALIDATDERIMTLLPQCSNTTFTHTGPAFVNVSFRLSEDGVLTTYQIGATTAAAADHLIAGGELVSGDDD